MVAEISKLVKVLAVLLMQQVEQGEMMMGIQQTLVKVEEVLEAELFFRVLGLIPMVVQILLILMVV